MSDGERIFICTPAKKVVVGIKGTVMQSTGLDFHPVGGTGVTIGTDGIIAGEIVAPAVELAISADGAGVVEAAGDLSDRV